MVWFIATTAPPPPPPVTLPRHQTKSSESHAMEYNKIDWHKLKSVYRFIRMVVVNAVQIGKLAPVCESFSPKKKKRWLSKYNYSKLTNW